MTESPVLRHLLIATILALTPVTAAADIVGSVNKVRAQAVPDGVAVRRPCGKTANWTPSHATWPAEPTCAVRRSRRIIMRSQSASVQISGVPDNGDIDRVLGRQFCSASTEPEFREMGAYRRGTDVWIALGTAIYTSTRARCHGDRPSPVWR